MGSIQLKAGNSVSLFAYTDLPASKDKDAPKLAADDRQ
jgi:hypothetical protein